MPCYIAIFTCMSVIYSAHDQKHMGTHKVNVAIAIM